MALEVAKNDGPDAALESVVIPALCLARRDSTDGDLDPADFRFAIRAAREIADEIGERREESEGSRDSDLIRLLIVPARDEADHVAADILAGALDRTRWDVHVTGDKLLASELVAAVEDFRPAVVVLMALPPGGLSHCRYLVGRLHGKCPDVRVVVARWGCPNLTNTEEPLESIRGGEGVDRTLSESRRRLAELYPVLQSEAVKSEQPVKRKPVGTAGATG